MQDWGLWRDEYFSFTEYVYSFKNGSYIELFGLEDEGKARGPSRDILFINEANMVKKTVFDQLAMRTTGQILIDLNPADFECWCYQVADKPENKAIHSTYLDNIQNLTKTQISYIEAYRDGDSYMWDVYGLGIRGKTTDMIYTHWKMCDSLPLRGELFMGCDFGYNVPTALVLCELYEGAIYVKELIYETRLTTNDLIEKYKEVGVSKTIEIYCDNAEPKTIEELRRAGYNAWEADKDVTEGIRKVKSLPLYICENSSNIVKEIKGYKWKTDVNGKPVKDKDKDEPVKFNDHCFVGDTVIQTTNGLSSLKNIHAGDFVFTSRGYKKVLIKWDNGLKQVKKYSLQFDTFCVILECTSNHLIKTKTGWQEISRLQSGQTVYLSNLLTDGYISSIQGKDILLNPLIGCTLLYGGTIKDQFQKDTTFIMEEITVGTIELKILNLNKGANICQNMVEKEQLIIQNGSSCFRRKEFWQQQDGIRAKRELIGINNTQRSNHSVNLILEKGSVINAEKILSEQQNIKNSVMQTARLKHLGQGEEMTKEVFDLTVDGSHEYFANGVLVHNCMDAIRYAVFTKLCVPHYSWVAM
jgi:phage terminase large subunit